MAQQNELKITNRKAPFIVLSNLLKETTVPKNKHGDMNWLSKNISSYITDDVELKKAKKLIDNLSFKKKGK
jgi:hypothetical protein